MDILTLISYNRCTRVILIACNWSSPLCTTWFCRALVHLSRRECRWCARTEHNRCAARHGECARHGFAVVVPFLAMCGSLLLRAHFIIRLVQCPSNPWCVITNIPRGGGGGLGVAPCVPSSPVGYTLLQILVYVVWIQLTYVLSCYMPAKTRLVTGHGTNCGIYQSLNTELHNILYSLHSNHSVLYHGHFT